MGIEEKLKKSVGNSGLLWFSADKNKIDVRLSFMERVWIENEM